MSEGDCFKVAFDIVVHEHRDDDTYRLCHGTVERDTDGLRHAHAWVEHVESLMLPPVDQRPPGFEHLQDTHMDMVIDKANGHDAHLPRVWYYRVGQVADVRRYTSVEAARLAVRTRHYGPWHSEANATDGPWHDDSSKLDIAAADEAAAEGKEA